MLYDMDCLITKLIQKKRLDFNIIVFFFSPKTYQNNNEMMASPNFRPNTFNFLLISLVDLGPTHDSQ